MGAERNSVIWAQKSACNPRPSSGKLNGLYCKIQLSSNSIGNFIRRCLSVCVLLCIAASAAAEEDAMGIAEEDNCFCKSIACSSRRWRENCRRIYQYCSTPTGDPAQLACAAILCNLGRHLSWVVCRSLPCYAPLFS